jgi:protein O-mannosyl-transferase
MVSAPAAPASPALRARPAVLAAGILAVAALVVFHNSLGGGFIFDDGPTVLENESIRDFKQVRAVLSPPPGAGVGGRPVANVSYALNYAFGGLDPRGYRTTNLAIHLLSALVLFGIVRRTLRLPGVPQRLGRAADGLALAVAGLWMLHPLQTAVVSYVSQRTEGLMALLYLLTLYTFVRGAADVDARPGRTGWLVASVASCALAMASKEVAVTAPVLVLLYDRTFLSGTWREAWQRRRMYYSALAATWLLLAALMLGSRVTERGVGFGLGVSAFRYVLTEASAVLTYLKLTVWPNPLVFDYGWAFVTANATAVLRLVACVGLVGACVWLLRRRPAIGFMAAWVLLILAPTSSIVPIIQQPIAESRMLLPLAGATALMVTAAHAALGRRVWPLLIVTALALGRLAAWRNADYRDPIALWSDTIEKRPANPRAHSNLAGALLAAGDFAAAYRHASAALRLEPGFGDAHTNAGAALLALGRPNEAHPHLLVVAKAQPDSSDAQFNLGNALHHAGRAAEALPHYESALRLNPRHPKALNNASVAYFDLGRFDEAIARAQAATQVDPNYVDAHYNLGNALLAARRPAEAIAAYEAALRLQPDFPSATRNLATARTLLGAGGR